MNDSSNQSGAEGRKWGMFLSCVFGIAAAGYFVGINDGVPRADTRADMGAVTTPMLASEPAVSTAMTESLAVIPAVSYAAMRRGENGPTSRWNPGLDQIPQPKFDLFAEIKPSEADKQQSTLTRASRRAFNGAPPVIPHAVENTADAACYA